jgi:hypothetical protein
MLYIRIRLEDQLHTSTTYLKLKEDIVFANKYLGENYAAIYKEKEKNSFRKYRKTTNYSC